MRQIVLITDGCSNVGMSPVIAAAGAQSEEIVVNVIGIVDHGEIGKRGAEEIEQIAAAGGGMSRIVTPQLLAQTVQMMTRKTVVHTVQQVVHKELKQILGHQEIDRLPPAQRAGVVQVIDDMAEKASIQIALLVDTSASMKPKLPAVKEAIRDLMLSLKAREGKSEIAVFHYPGTQKEMQNSAVLDAHWTEDLAKIDNLFYKLNMKGTTPTGPALLQVVQYMTPRHRNEEMQNLAIPSRESKSEGGMLSDYII